MSKETTGSKKNAGNQGRKRNSSYELGRRNKKKKVATANRVRNRSRVSMGILTVPFMGK
jgi:hypothetical protein